VLKESIETHIPTKKVYYNKNQPCWFGKKAQKLVTKQNRTYKKYKQTGDVFFLSKYKLERRNTQNEIRRIKISYLAHNICSPLARGNSKPFFEHLKIMKQQTSISPISLLCLKNQITEDSKKCAILLNEFFRDQFRLDHQIQDIPPLTTNNEDVKILKMVYAN